MNSSTAIAKSDSELERLEKGLRIDKYDLDKELMDHSRYYNEIAQRFADAVSYRDEAKSEFEGVKAKLDQMIRAEIAAANEKLTEGGLNSRVIAAIEYQRALAVLASWNDRTLRWTGLRDAAQQRGYALKDMASLYIAGYWADRSGAQVSREAKGERAAAGRGVLVEAEQKRQTARKPLPNEAVA